MSYEQLVEAVDNLATSNATLTQAARDALERVANHTKVNSTYPFDFVPGTVQYDVKAISGDQSLTTAGMALWVEGTIVYPQVDDLAKFTLLDTAEYTADTKFLLIGNARFDDVLSTLNAGYQGEKAARVLDYYQYLTQLQLEPAVPYLDGLTLVRPTQTVLQSGVLYRPKPEALPILTTTWPTDVTKFIPANDMGLRQDLVAPEGGNGVGLLRTALTTAIKDVNGFFSASAVNLWELAYLVTYKPTLLDPTTWDWGPALQALNGKCGVIPGGTYPTRQQVEWNLNGTNIKGASAASLGGSVIKPMAPFVGTHTLVIGNLTGSTVVPIMNVGRLRIDHSGWTGTRGVGVYGLRDGSTIDKIFVRNCERENFYFGQAGGGTGTATGRMNQGISVTDCHAINQEKAFTVPYVWMIDGVFESTFKNCKALASSIMENEGVIGFGVGVVTESRATWLHGCSSGNLINTAGADSNGGIHYGEWADSCGDFEHTYENIKGYAARFHGGLASGRARPFNCKSINPRLYANPNAGIMDPAYRFGDCGACFAGPIVYWESTKKSTRFEAPVGTGSVQFNNWAEVHSTLDVDASGNLAAVEFVTGTAASAYVKGIASSTTERKKFFVTPGHNDREIYSNGAQFQHDTFWSGIQAGSPNKIRLRDNAGTTMFTFDGTGTPTNTSNNRLILGGAWDAANKLIFTNRRVWWDSFGVMRHKTSEPTSETDGSTMARKVAVPATATSAGAPGDWAANSTYLFAYTGDGTTHTWVRSAAAAW